MYRLLKLSFTRWGQYRMWLFGVDVELNSRMEVDEETVIGGRNLVWWQKRLEEKNVCGKNKTAEDDVSC